MNNIAFKHGAVWGRSLHWERGLKYNKVYNIDTLLLSLPSLGACKIVVVFDTTTLVDVCFTKIQNVTAGIPKYDLVILLTVLTILNHPTTNHPLIKYTFLPYK